ncbi:hypothetical protein BKA62DRAFT_632806 [Auriculariales sp. MPI-PUGE-AT-0066]|nr:hypothetical protein BKA62DRAFT_632806 [Auriculariales sp. MPI-PUGE-AT-0066]
MATFEDDANPFRTEVDGDLTVSQRALSPDPADTPFRDVHDDDEHEHGHEQSEPTTTQPQPQPGLPPLPAKASSFPTTPSNWSTDATQRNDCGCARDRYLHDEDDAEILIVDAQKTAEGSSGTYIVYVIKTGTSIARRRYSEFESLRNALVRLYPIIIIPPIPDKQSISDYAVKQSKAKEDATMIARRKRMLQTFLNRLARHQILSKEHSFHRFLDGEVSWSEVLHSDPIALIPKDILKASPLNPCDPNPNPAYQALPHPSPAASLHNPDQRFLDSEAFTNKFAGHLSGPLEKVTRRTMKRWSDYGNDHAELGGIFNGFSLSESGALAATMEKTGQAIDANYLATTQLLQDFEQRWAEPLHEYSQFASVIRKVLAFRHQKHVQFEMTRDNLESKRAVMGDLDKSEAEAQRLHQALARPANSQIGGVFGAAATAHQQEDQQQQNPYGTVQRQTEIVPPRPRRGQGGSGLLSALSYSIQTMMDVDPETARRNNISKTRESIGQLDDALQLAGHDLKFSSQAIQADLDRFQRQKVADLREMALAMARMHRDWCKQNLEAWEEVKKEATRIEPHPNHAPSPPSTSDTKSPAPAPAGPSA